MLQCQELGFLSGTRGWHKRFREGREDVEDDPKSGRPTTSRTNENVEHVREKVCSDCRLTVRMIADELSMNSERGSLQKIWG